MARPDGLYLAVAIDNTGRGLTKGEGVVTLADDGFEQKFSIDTFLPGTSPKWRAPPSRDDFSPRAER